MGDVQVKGQMGMDEKVLDLPALEAALEERVEASIALIQPRSVYQQANEKVSALIKEHVAVGEVVRIGRFRIERVEVPPEHREFDTKGGDRVRIKTDGD